MNEATDYEGFPIVPLEVYARVGSDWLPQSYGEQAEQISYYLVAKGYQKDIDEVKPETTDDWLELLSDCVFTPSFYLATENGFEQLPKRLVETEMKR